jgi:hypothetical protein
MPEGRPYPKCYEPYLRYAISTNFSNFEFFDERIFSLFLLVELKQANHAADFEGKMVNFGAVFGPQFGRPEFGPNIRRTRYVTMRAGTAAVLDYDAGTSMFPESSCRCR